MQRVVKVLVAATGYPDLAGSVSLMYIHARNREYVKNGISVTVLSFGAKESYVIDGIQVITLQRYIRDEGKYDILICHAPNLRNHFRFLLKYGGRFPQMIFFFHGHEVLRLNRTYSKPYPYMQKSALQKCLQDMYDAFKLWVWRQYFPRVAHKSHFVFVSQWMLDEFRKSTGIDVRHAGNKYKYTITYNCIGSEFENVSFDATREKKYDFVTIRGSLDGSKYCIDIVNAIAKANPQYTFLVIGKGDFFAHYDKADNVVWQNVHMDHNQIIQTLQTARCALMPTRTDAQGVMMCEMASIGMPVITSDIPVCHEVFESFDNIAMIDNEDTTVDLNAILSGLESGLPYKKNERYFNKKTSGKEIAMIKCIARQIDDRIPSETIMGGGNT